MKLIRVRIILLITIVGLIFLSHLPKSFGNEDSGDDYYYDDENSQNNTQDNASQEEYEGYEDEQAIQRESMEMEVGGDGSFFEPEPEPEEEEFMYGFIRNSGGGLIKINELLVNEEYLNYTRDRYDCLKLEDLIVPIVEYVEEEEPEISIEEQLAQMKNKLNKAIKGVMQAIDGKDGSSEENNEPSPDDKSQNTTESNNTTNADSKKRLTFREKQALRMKERQEKEAQRELVKPKYRLGADCETLICGACKAIVEEFGYAVAKAVPDRNIKYIDQITEGFCFTKQISLKYREIVSDLCKTFDKDELGYKEAMIQSYEEHPDWSTIGSLTSILDKQEKVCLQVGACQPEYFEFQREPLHEKQEQWNSSCFVCQAFAKNLEERIHLSRFLTEVTIVPLVAQTCDRLRLPGEYDELCRKLTKGKLLDDIAWLAKVHEESIVKKAKAELRFPDKLCEEIDWCEPWIDPEQLKEKEIRKQLEPVYF